eukprot:9687797-Prorocentrum_lima.AAC.1
MTSSLVGSEMCIRDSRRGEVPWCCLKRQEWPIDRAHADPLRGTVGKCHCLLYTSDAADDM